MTWHHVDYGEQQNSHCIINLNGVYYWIVRKHGNRVMAVTVIENMMIAAVVDLDGLDVEGYTKAAQSMLCDTIGPTVGNA